MAVSAPSCGVCPARRDRNPARPPAEQKGPGECTTGRRTSLPAGLPPRHRDASARGAAMGGAACILRPVQRIGIGGAHSIVTTTSILLLSAVAEAAEPIAAALRAAGHQVTTLADADEAVRAAGEFTLVIDRCRRAAAHRRRRLRRDPADAGPGRRSRSCASPRRTTSRSASASSRPAPTTSSPGPFDPRELEARVEGLLIRFQRSRDLAPHDRRRDSRRRPPAPHRLLQPQGRRGNHDDRGQRRRWPSPGRRPDQVADHRPRRRLRPGGHPPEREAAPDRRGPRGRRRRRCCEPDLLRTYAEKVEPGLHVIAAPATPETRAHHHGRAGRRRSSRRRPAPTRSWSWTPARPSTSGRSTILEPGRGGDRADRARDRGAARRCTASWST